MNIFFISDHHFFHKNIIKYVQRPFEFSINGMYENAKYMYKKHNETVKNDDLVFFLGDVALFKSSTKKYIQEMLKSLNGKKILIRGNHDTESDQFYKNCGFLSIHDYLIFGKLMLCHYPLVDNLDLKNIFYKNKCKILIHGHTHEKIVQSNDFKRINVCVEQLNYTPFQNENLTKYIKYFLRGEKWAEMLQLR